MDKIRKGADVLAIIKDSKNVRAACKALGISRSQYYKLLSNSEPAPKKVYTPSRIGAETAAKIKELALICPFGCHSIHYKLADEGVDVSVVSIQKVLKYFHLGTAPQRLRALEEWIVASKTYVLNNEQEEFLTKRNPAILEHHRSIKTPGELITIFGYFLGLFPMLGKVQVYFALDAYSGYVQAILSFVPDMFLCAEFLKDKVFPFYEQQGFAVKGVETSNDPEFFSYGIHPFSSFLRNLDQVKYQRTTVGGVKTNGYSLKWHQYLQTQIVPKIKQQKDRYSDLEHLHDELQEMLKIYNTGESNEAREYFGTYPFLTRIPASNFNL